MKDILVFDTTDAGTIADSDHVGSHTLSGSGELIDSKTIAAQEWLNVAAALHAGNGTAITETSGALNVNIASSAIQIEADLDGVYDVGDNANPDNVGFIAHSRAATPGDAEQGFRSTGGTASSDDVVAANVHGLDVNAFGMIFDGTNWDRLRGTSGAVHINDGGNSITVDATDLDIRDLAFASDSVTAHQGGTWIIDSITNDVSIDDGGNSITVDATDLDIRDLTHVSDSVQLGDGTNLITSTLIGGKQSLDVYISGAVDLTVSDAALANTAIASGATALASVNTAQDVIASPLANRKYLHLYNADNKRMYVGQSGVSAATGFPVSPGSYIVLRAGAAVDIEYVSDKENHDLRYLELS